MTKLNAAFILTFLPLLLLFSGCNGSSGENDNSVTLIADSINLSIVNASGETQQSFDASESVTLKALVLDEDGKKITNQLVNFSAGIGTLAPNSKLTNSDGIAIITITNSELTLGAATAVATIQDITTSLDYEYTSNNIGETTPTISTQLLLNGEPVNQFNADQLINITTTLVDENGQVINGEIISFTADIGTLSTSSALTVNGFASVTLTSDNDNIGAGVITATILDESASTPQTNRINYEILSSDTPVIDNEIRLGYFNDSNEFIEGEIQLSITDDTISAGGSLGLTVALVDSTNTLVNAPAQVTFASNCVQRQQANIDETVFSIKGYARATYEDINCAGASGTEDVIFANLIINGITSTASATINITGEQLGSIEFVSAEPTTIVLKGTGGQETSTLTFMVKGELGNVLPQQAVDFTLNTTVGGISLSRGNGFTNSQGLITTQVGAGTVPTAVRVTAKATTKINDEETYIQTQSDLLSINTGLPEQRSLTIAANPLNPEADINGSTSEISVWLADNFNNPVPDGTTVNFTTEGGVIQPSCSTTGGQCSVTWTSALPRVDNHRITILATAVGHETFFDTNGNNTFDNADGSAIVNETVSSGLGRHNAEPSGFIDMSEAWRDDNENDIYDSGETFLDFNNDQSFTSEDNLFNGPQCQGDKCTATNSIHVRKALRFIMSGSAASYQLFDSTTVYEDSFTGANSVEIPAIADGGSQPLTFAFADLAGQALPMGTTISIAASVGELNGITNATVPNTNSTGSMGILLTNSAGGDPESGLLTFIITSPSGITTTLLKEVNLL